MARVLIPLPQMDFDPSEAAVSWRVLSQRGHEVVFATPDGTPAVADDRMITGEGLDPWGWIPGLRRVTLVGRVLRADAVARAAHAEIIAAPQYRRPARHDEIDVAHLDGLLIPGGHRARGMRPYLESATLQSVVVDAFRRELPVAAVCHGALLVARSVDPRTGRSVLYGRRTTALTWSLERLSWRLGRIVRF